MQFLVKPIHFIAHPPIPHVLCFYLLRLVSHFVGLKDGIQEVVLAQIFGVELGVAVDGRLDFTVVLSGRGAPVLGVLLQHLPHPHVVRAHPHLPQLLRLVTEETLLILVKGDASLFKLLSFRLEPSLRLRLFSF